MNEEKIEKHTEIEKVKNPKVIYSKDITVSLLQSLKNSEEIIMEHPHIKGLQMKIRKVFTIKDVLNVPVVFYGEKYIVSDNGDRVFPQHNLLLNEEEMVAYINKLLSCQNQSYFYYYRTLERLGLAPGNVIQFNDGKKGIIVIPEGEIINRNPMYVPLKKDGTKSNHKPRYIYANTVYEKIHEQL